MASPFSSEMSAELRLARRARLRRLLRRTMYVNVSVAFVLVVLTSMLYLRLIAGPISLQDHTGRVGSALAQRIGSGWRVDLADTNLELYGAKPAVQVSGLEIRNPAGHLVLRAPHAVVSLDPLSLAVGTLSPREIELRDLQVRALMSGDGTLTFVAQGEPAPSASPAPPGEGTDPAPRPSAVSAAFASLLEPLLRSTSLIGALDRAVVTNARVALIGPDGAERAAFDRVGARFERGDAGERRIELDLAGRHGAWRARGQVRDGPGRTGELSVENLPVADLLLLAGPGMPAVGTDLRLDGRLSGTLADGRLTSLEGRFSTSAGGIARGARPDLKVERVAGAAAWDETRRALTLSGVEIRSEGSEIRLEGELTALAAGRWGLRLTGRDSVVAGLTTSDRAFRVDSLAVDAAFDGEGISLERAALKGPDLDMTLSGASLPGPQGADSQGAGPQGAGAQARIAVAGTDVRRLLRFWPDVLAANLRQFLVESLTEGFVERLDLQARLNGPDLRRALADQPIPDDALAITFALRKGVLSFEGGLPPLSGLGIDGALTGTTVKLVAPAGRVNLPEGRRLTFSEGSYAQSDYDDPASVARISFRVAGGADAFAAYLRSPLLREAGAPDIDPAGVRGRGDVRVSLPLAVHRIPPVSELPFAVQGQIADLSLEKLIAREKVEGGQFALGYDRGVLSVKGEARLSGTPATIDLQVPRKGAGAVTIQLTLDDAARARRALPVAPLIAGPIPVKVVASLGAGGKSPVRIEADLGRAAIDGLVPGWTKPAGRPGRLSFQLPDPEGAELRDLTLDAGSAQLKGQVSLAPGGGLEKADLTTFKLSPGDDLRALVERAGAGFRVSLRGAVGDARPVLRWMAGAGSSSGGQKGAVRDVPDVDLDLAVNILTGHNDEALTGVAARVSLANRELKSLQLSGRSRGGALDARLAKRDAGDPILSVSAGDAGAALRFLDLYRRMVGGKLALEARMGESAQEGTITIDSFKLRGEPALNRLVSESVPMGTEDRNGGMAERFNPNDVQFVKLTGGFRRNASRIDYDDIVIWGSQVGFNLSGSVDYGRDRTDISGTFVPAYTLNNAFSQVPIVGMLLGGGRNEGLFAVDFRISGQASAPTVTINPLSAVAPGILRKLFGWMLPEGGDAAGTTGATRPPAVAGER